MFQIKEMMYGTGETFSYFLCPECGCLQIKDMPADMPAYYRSDYYSFKSPDQTGYLKKFLRRSLYKSLFSGTGLASRFLRKRYSDLSVRSLFPLKPGKEIRILDIGTGSGFLPYQLKEMGFKKVLGIDPHIKEHIRYENGLEILKCPISRVEGRWDLVMFHHCLEHIPDQFEALGTAGKKLLSPGGWCLVRVPVMPSYAWERYRENWVSIDAPRHLFIHSVKSLSLVAERSGLKLEKVIYDSNEFQFTGSELYSRGIPLRAENSLGPGPIQNFSRQEIKYFRNLAAKLNEEKRGDTACFYFRKTDN